MIGKLPFELLNQSCPGHADLTTWLHKMSEVVQVQVVRPKIVEGVHAHNGVKEIAGKRQGPSVRMQRKHAVPYADVSDALQVLRSADPQVRGPNLHAKL